MSEEFKTEWRKKLAKLNELPQMKQYELANGWKLYTNDEFSFWNNAPDYLIMDDECDTIFVFHCELHAT